MSLGQPRRPYTAEQVGTLYPMLTAAERELVSHIEFRFRGWEIWPDLNYPKDHFWFGRRQFTRMQPLKVAQLGNMPSEIENWTASYAPIPPQRSGT